MLAQLRKRLKESLSRFSSGPGREGSGAGPRVSDSAAARSGTHLDPAALARLGNSPLIARLVVEGFLTGLHKSPFHGFSVEFADHREYVPGDDLKYLDWKVYARTDRYYVKRFEEETNLRCYILLDCSHSMNYGTTGVTKWDYGCFLASCLAYLMLKQQDAAGLSLFGDKPGVFVPPRCRSSHLRQLMQVMMRQKPEGRTDIGTSVKSVLRNIKRRGLVVIISDLIDSPEDTAKAIRLIRGHKHDVIVFQLLDAAELEFPFAGATVLEDMETGDEVEIDPAALRAHYLEKLEESTAWYRKAFMESGVDYQLIDTRNPYDAALAAYLDRRAKMRG